MPFSRNPFLAVAVIQAVAVLGCHGVLADDVGTAARAGKPRPRAAPRPGPPATMGVNPNAREHFDRIELQSLTAKQARTLVNRYRDSNRTIDLVGLTTLDAAAARALADFKGPHIIFRSLTALDAKSARELAKFNGHGLTFIELPAIDAETARELVLFKGAIVLEGLARLDADTARVLVENQNKISFSFPRLPMLDAETARELVRIDRGLSLSGLTSLDAETARTLAHSRAWNGDLSSVTTIDFATARALGEFKNGVRLSGLKALDAATVRMLTMSPAWNGDLSGVAAIDAATANALAEFKGRGSLRLGLTKFDAATARAFAGFKGSALGLQSLATLDAAAVTVVAQYPFQVVLPSDLQRRFFAENPLTPETAAAWAILSHGQLAGITAFDSPDSVAVARVLASTKGQLVLPNLKRISPKTLAALLDKEDIVIPRIETLEIIPEPDGGPSDDGAAPNKPGGPK